MKKLIYLKTLVGKQPELNKEEFTKNLKDMCKDIQLDIKPRTAKEDFKLGKEFIIKHTPEFLASAIDYSLADTIKEELFR